MFKREKTIHCWHKKKMAANHGILDITFSQKTGRIYVSNIRTPGLLVINGEKNEFLKIIPYDPEHKIFEEEKLHFFMGETAWNSLNNKLYAVTDNPPYLFIIDEDKETCINQIPLNSGARGVAIDKKSGNVFVSHYGKGWLGGDNKVSVFDLENKLIKQIEVGIRPWEIAVDSENERTYISCKGNNLYIPGELYIIDNKKLDVIEKVRIGRRPRGITINQNMNKIYSSARFDFATYVIDSNSLNLLKIIENDCDPISSVYNPNNNQLYMINRQGKMKPDEVYKGALSTVQVVDCKNDEVIKTLEIGKTAHYGVLNKNNNLIYIPCEDSLDVWIIDTTKNLVSGKIDLGRCLDGIKLDKKRKLIFSTSHITNEVSVIDIKKEKFIGSFNVGGWPYELDINPIKEKVYINEHEQADISVHNEKTYTLIKKHSLKINSLFCPGNPIVETHNDLSSWSGISVDTRRNKIYSVSAKENLLFVIDEQKQTLDKIYIGWQGLEGPGVFDVKVNEETNCIYILNPRMLKIIKVDGKKKKVQKIINLGSFSIDLSSRSMGLIRLMINEFLNHLYVGSYIIDLQKDKIILRLSKELGDVIIACNHKNSSFFTLNIKEKIVNIIDERSLKIIDNFALVRRGNAFEFDEELNKFIVLPLRLYSSEVDIYGKTKN